MWRGVAKKSQPWQTEGMRSRFVPCRPRASRVRPNVFRAHLAVCFLGVAATLAVGCASSESGAEFTVRLPDLERVWIGPDFYGNRLQDWRLSNQRIEAVAGDSRRSMRTLQLLTYALSEESGRLEMSVRTGPIVPGGTRHENTWTGFLIGAGGDHVDYRISALVHDWPAPDGGLIVALDGTGKIVVRDNSGLEGPKSVRPAISTSADAWPLVEPTTIELSEEPFDDVVLRLEAEPMGSSAAASGSHEGSEAGQAQAYRLTVSVHDTASGRQLGEATYENIAAEYLSGHVGLISHNSRHLERVTAMSGGAGADGSGAGASGSDGGGPGAEGGAASRQLRPFEAEANTTGPGYWFRDWTVGGSKVVHHPDRAFGPVMGAMHTLSGGVLKMTAQMGPLGTDDVRTAELQIQRGGRWETVATGELVDLSYTIPFRVEDWDGSAGTPYRIAYDLRVGGLSAGMTQAYTYEGTIRRIPDRNDFILASMNCQHFSAAGRGHWNHSSIWFPHAETAAAVGYHNPDMLFFSGDQIYEGGLSGIVREPLDEAALDYLYHWYWFVWAFRDLMRDIPTIATPDDHDVYQGNIWGAGGKKAEGRNQREAQTNGGYTMDPRWVNAVHATQTSHHPDPYDPTPIEQGISVWYSSVDYGGVSMAVVSDRMFKSSPTLVEGGQVDNGWFQNPRFDPARSSDVPGAALLGQRQLDFLEDWVQDWSGGIWMKVLLSQTLFSNLATIPEGATSGNIIPSLAYAGPGGYVQGDKKAADADSGGWPQSGRNRALRVMRKAFAMHVAGDQHLGSTVKYGIDDFNDASYAFVVPSVANLWPRRWFPPEPGANREPGAPPYTGKHFDGFGNRMTVHAVANPVRSGVQPEALYDRVPGYGIVRFDKLTRDITVEAWPRWVDPSASGAAQFFGWPVTFNQLDNYGGGVGHLPTIEVSGMSDPVVQLIRESTGEVVYTLRIAGTSFQPKVFDAAETYTVAVGEPGTGQLQRLTGLRISDNPAATIEVVF